MTYPNYGVDNKKGCVQITVQRVWFTCATQMQMQEQTTFTRRTQTQRWQDTQEQSRTVKLFPRWRSRVKLWPQEVYFSWFSNIECLRDENNRYLFNATENVRLYCKQFEIHFHIQSDCICCLYFLPLNIRFFGRLVLLPHLFKQEFSPIYLRNVYHKAPDISLYYLPISRLKWKEPSCFQLQCAVVAWNRWNRVFFIILAFALRRFTRVKCKRKRKCKRKKMTLFPFLALELAFAFTLMKFTRVFSCFCVCICVARVNQA